MLPAIGNTRRRLSFFVMVLVLSRQMYVEFTVSQTIKHFLACHERAFNGVQAKILVDNLKSAVLRRLARNHDVERLFWRLGPAGSSPIVTGIDVAQFKGGRIHSLYVLLNDIVGGRRDMRSVSSAKLN